MEDENKKSGVKGVTWDKGAKKWTVMYRGQYFGLFDRMENAIQKRKEVESTAEPRFCVICGKPIPANRHARATTCSEKCVQERDRRYMAKKRLEYKLSREKPNRNHMQTLNITIPPEMLKKIKTTANATGISASEYVRQLIQKGIEIENLEELK